MVSHGWPGGDEGIEEHGHASPIATPSICVREFGQILARPLIKTAHRVGIVIIGTEEAWVDGCERR